MCKATSNLTHKLPKAQQPLLKLLGAEASKLEYTAYVVGGFVRDSLLNDTAQHQSSNFLDIDIVLDGNTDEKRGILFAQHIQDRYGGQIITHEPFGTATWITNEPAAPIDLAALNQHAPDLHLGSLPAQIDFVTTRAEIYAKPAALPTVTPSDLNHDLRRRDITINTLAVSLAPATWQQLCDQHNGIHDIKAGLIRILHDQSFIDDPTRIFRAIRYEHRFDFDIEPHTLALLKKSLPQIAKLTPVRVRHELDRTLQEEATPEKILHRMARLGVLAAIHPELTVDAKTEQTFVQLRTTLAQPPAHDHDAAYKILATKSIYDLYWILTLAALPVETSRNIAQRVELPKETLRIAHDLHALNQAETWSPSQQTLAAPNRTELSPSQVVAAIAKLDPLAVALFATDPTATRQRQLHAAQYLAQWRHITPILSGNDLRQLGIPPGPQYRELLTALRNQRLDGLLTDRASEIAYIKKNLQK